MSGPVARRRGPNVAWGPRVGSAALHPVAAASATGGVASRRSPGRGGADRAAGLGCSTWNRGEPGSRNAASGTARSRPTGGRRHRRAPLKGATRSAARSTSGAPVAARSRARRAPPGAQAGAQGGRWRCGPAPRARGRSRDRGRVHVEVEVGVEVEVEVEVGVEGRRSDGSVEEEPVGARLLREPGRGPPPCSPPSRDRGPYGRRGLKRRPGPAPPCDAPTARGERHRWRPEVPATIALARRR
jgi:hypothetical protein